MVRSPCCNREHTRRGTWSKEEDMLLIKHMNTHGVVDISWRSLPKMAGLNRCGKSCRLRWVNYLKPDVKRGNFDSTENDMIIKLHAEFGNKWSLIAGKLNGRTDNEIKNHWNTNLKRMLLDKGIDPKTHKPLNGSPDQSTVTSTAPPTADANKTGTGSSIDSFINTNTLPTTDFATSGMHVVINNTIDAPTNAEPDLFVLTTNKNNNNNNGDNNNNIVPNLINLPLGLPSHKPKSCPMNPLAWLKLGQKSG